MAADEFRKLSPEQLQKLSRAISDAKALTNQQAKIIEDVIAGEIDIGKLRISYLNEYFDTYSKSLDLVARKHSALNDAFLVLDRKINESFKKVVTEGTKAVAELVKAAEKATGSTSKPQTTKQEESTASDSDEKQKPDKPVESKELAKPDSSLAKAIAGLREDQLKQHSECTGKIADLLTSIAKLELARHQLGRNEISSVTDLLVSKFQEAATGITSPRASVVEQRDLTKPPIYQVNPSEDLTVDLALAGYKPFINALPEDTPAEHAKVPEPTTEAGGLSPAIKSLSELLHASVSALTSISEIATRTSLGLNKYDTPTTSSGDNGGGNNNSNNNGNNNTPGGNPPQSVKPYNTVEAAARNRADEEDLDQTVNLVGGIFTALKLEGEESAKAATAIAEQYGSIGVLADRYGDKEAEQIEALARQRKETARQLMDLDIARRNDEAGQIRRLTELQLDHIQKTTNAELKAQLMLNDNAALSERTETEITADSALLLQHEAALELQKDITILEEQRLGEIAKKRLEKELETGRRITAAELAEITAKANEAYKLDTEHLAKIAKQREILGDKYFEEQKSYQNTLIALDRENQQDAITAEARLAAVKLANQKKLAEAQLQAQQLLNDVETARKYEATAEGIDDADKTADELERHKVIQQLEAQRTKWIATEELRLRRTNGRELTLEERQKIREEAAAAFSLEQEHIKKQAELRKKLSDEYFAKEDKLADINHALEKARSQEKGDIEARLLDVLINKRLEASEAELKAQELINSLNAEREFADSDEGRLLHINLTAAAENQKSIQQVEAARADFIAKKELELKLKNNGKISAIELAEIQRQADLEFALTEENIEKETKLRLAAEAKDKRDEEKAKAKAQADKGNELFSTLFGTGNSIQDRIDAFKDLATDPETEKTDLKSVGTMMVKAIGTLAAKLEDSIDRIASSKAAVDTRLQGSSNETTWTGSYWDQIVKDMASVGAINPYFKQEDFAKNIKELVNKGIAFDLEQRAFLMTIQEKIANTFNVADGTLLRLIRIQQEDSSAGRLGMEASLNAFLNEMYETTEYLSDVASSVRSSLEEMESLMAGAEATEVEYQVQKWLGSLYSVGMSQNAVNSISQTLGQIASGQIDGLTNGGAGNLLVMAANDAGLSIADVLTDGIDASDTNRLMQSVVNYLAEIAESSKDNNVVQQQLANVFGVKASDLRAATNLAAYNSVENIYGELKSYENLLNKLFALAGSMGSRTSMAEMLTNIWENGQYTLAGSVASSPAAYIIYKAASLLDDAVGGINLPFLNVAGFGVDLNTTVADLMRVASMSTGILGSIGPILSGLGNSFSGQSMLNQLGISSGTGLTITPRGGVGGGNIGAAGGTVSESGYFAGNASGNDIKNSTIQESKDTKKQLMVEAKEEEEANQVNVLNTTVLKIYELLDDVAHGSGCFSVKVEGYGLTKGSSSGSTLGGVSALSGLSNNVASGSLGENTTNSTSGIVNSSGFTGSVDFGGWTTVM
jgi:hypothetical protein